MRLYKNSPAVCEDTDGGKKETHVIRLYKNHGNPLILKIKVQKPYNPC